MPSRYFRGNRDDEEIATRYTEDDEGVHFVPIIWWVEELEVEWPLFARGDPQELSYCPGHDEDLYAVMKVCIYGDVILSVGLGHIMKWRERGFSFSLVSNNPLTIRKYKGWASAIGHYP